MLVRIEFEYPGHPTVNTEEDYPGYFQREREYDWQRLPAVEEGVEFDPGSEDGGGAGKVTWIMWGADGTPRLHIDVKVMGTYMTRQNLKAQGWEDIRE